MDRTVTWKSEDKDLSILLYKKLYGLTLLYPATDAFRKCLSEEMFLKPNTNAFFHVMHYLFRILDPNEFKKRFYWPINDKRGEAYFRSSTIDYLKHLNEKHNLNWTNIKAYLFITPGGMKFINFLLDFVGFVIQELTKQREKELSISSTDEKPTKSSLELIKRQHKFHKEYASAYITAIDDQIVVLNEKIDKLNKEFERISSTTHVSVDDLQSDEFILAYEDFNKELYQKNVVDSTDALRALDEPLEGLKKNIEKVLSKETEPKYDCSTIQKALNDISTAYGIDLPHDNDENDDIKLNDLIVVFNAIFSTVESQIETLEEITSTNEFVNVELKTLLKELEQIHADIMNFQKTLNCYCNRQRSKKQKDNFKTPMRGALHATTKAQSSLMSKYVSTPPIKLEMPENNPTRLPLLDDYKNEDAFNGLLVLAAQNAVPQTHRRGDSTLMANDGNTTMNKSKIIDPMQLLRTINKDTSRVRIQVPHINLTTLGSKWKERQLLFNQDADMNLNVTIKTEVNQSAIKASLTPFNCNDLTRISRSQLLDSSNVNNGSPLRFPNKILAVKKVQNDTLNLHNLSTSPSGRLDPLVMLTEKEANILQVNDNMQKLIKQENEMDDLTLNMENNLNILNTPVLKRVSIEKNEEDLCNTSDSVLNDVLM